MASPTLGHEQEFVALVFSRTAHDSTSWKTIIAALSKALNLPIPEFRCLDHANGDQSVHSRNGRVAEAKYRSEVKIDLRDCKNLSDSNLQSIEKDHNVEVLLQPADLYSAHRQPGLAVFDMDSTLIQQEVIDELARAVGLYDQCAAITAAAMRGEAPYTDFTASLKARVGLLKGVPLTIWDDLKRDVINFTPGARELIKALRGLGWKTAVLSGGFMPLANWVKTELGLDYALANSLVEDSENGCLAGELVDGKAIIDGEMKRIELIRLAKDYGIPKERIIAVGDGANDLKMMEAAGMGIAFHAKPKVQVAAPSRLNTESLRDVLYILGYGKGEVEPLL